MPFPLPGFELASPQAIDPKLLVRSESDALGALMLSLALAYNDLKDAEYALHGMNERRAEAESGTVAQAGQFAGMMHHVARSLCAVVHEVLLLLYDKRRLVASRDFQKYVEPLNERYKATWQSVWNAAQGSARQQDTLSRQLMRVRNKIAGHYEPGALTKGYLAHFGSGTSHSEHAVVSAGEDMEGTRFFYADAAATAFLQREETIDYVKLSAVAGEVNLVIYALLRQFIDERAPSRMPYDPA